MRLTEILMGKPKLPEDEFIETYRLFGPQYLSEKTGTSLRNINYRRKRLEKKHKTQIAAPGRAVQQRRLMTPAVLETSVQDGCVIIGSDPHYFPNDVSTAHIAMVKLIRELQPKVVILDGDVFDGASVSRHPPIGWESIPTVEEEINACKLRLWEIATAAGQDAELYWPLGNHDGRFETRLAQVAPEYAKVHGTSLHHHFDPRWKHCWAVQINDNVMVKHRIKGGDHAAFRNTILSGVNTVTGHLHKGYVRPFTDYNGTRYGVDLPTLAEPYGHQFRDYTEMNPVDWRSGFCVLTFKDGLLLQPELAFAVDQGSFEFRWELREVSGDDLLPPE